MEILKTIDLTTIIYFLNAFFGFYGFTLFFLFWRRHGIGRLGEIYFCVMLLFLAEMIEKVFLILLRCCWFSKTVDHCYLLSMVENPIWGARSFGVTIILGFICIRMTYRWIESGRKM